jgi:calcineurin-like phosphoesterase family protein
MPNTFIASDHHFYHRNIVKFEKSRTKFGTFEGTNLLSADLDAMNQAIIDAHNSVVTPEDTTYFLGDFSWKPQKTKQLLEQLNGTKILILGNHDDERTTKHFTAHHHYLELNYQGTNLCLMHYPIAEWNRMHQGSIMIHGHVHGGPTVPGRIFDCYIGGNNLAPYKLDDVIEKMKQLPVRPHGFLFSGEYTGLK